MDEASHANNPRLRGSSRKSSLGEPQLQSLTLRQGDRRRPLGGPLGEKRFERTVETRKDSVFVQVVLVFVLQGNDAVIAWGHFATDQVDTVAVRTVRTYGRLVELHRVRDGIVEGQRLPLFELGQRKAREEIGVRDVLDGAGGTPELPF